MILVVPLLVLACKGGNDDGKNDAGNDTTGDETADATSMADDGVDKFDTLNEEETGTADDGSTECGCGELGWSYLWAANADESTVSKLNTRTMVEEGRYRTHAEDGANPSRTSVSVDAHAVVVQNRNKPAIVKLWAQHEFCDEMKNGVPGLQTSMGANDVLGLDEDDCVAWYKTFDDMTVQRPVQWTTGEQNADCDYLDQKIWTVTGQNGTPGHCGTDGVWVQRLNGGTGDTEEKFHIPEEEFPCAGTRGAYGGAVDEDGNFWFQGWQTNKLARVEFDTLDYQVWDVPGNGYNYGITVDREGRAWLTDPLQRFDPESEEWVQGPVSATTGIAEDSEGRMWLGDGTNLTWVDRETLVQGDVIQLPDQNLPQENLPRGIAVDVDGMVWAVRRIGIHAYRVDPADPQNIAIYDGLDTAYTYSDMTGGQLQGVTCKPKPQG
jgi:DNA-binding beta-propeller fold protein YncE